MLDNCGNRTSVVDAGTTKLYTPNNLNQYNQTAHGAPISNGPSHEISTYGGTTYAYMGDSYLARATATNGDSYTLYYDALGRCVKRTTAINGVGSTTNYYLFDGEHWVMEYDGSGAIQSNALYGGGIDEVIKRDVKVNGVMQGWYYFPDRNGNTSVVTDGANLVRESYRYDAFGAPTVTVGAGQPALNNRILFTGREWNPTFGFYEYRARAYNPTLGRFMSEDPKGFDAGDYNLYRYVGNDPLDLTDPMGLTPQELERWTVLEKKTGTNIPTRVTWSVTVDKQYPQYATRSNDRGQREVVTRGNPPVPVPALTTSSSSVTQQDTNHFTVRWDIVQRYAQAASAAQREFSLRKEPQHVDDMLARAKEDYVKVESIKAEKQGLQILNARVEDLRRDASFRSELERDRRGEHTLKDAQGNPVPYN